MAIEGRFPFPLTWFKRLRRAGDRGQCPENQLVALREWCARSGHEVAGEYVEHESGRKGTERRAQFARLFEDANRRQFDLVLFWALDRFSREGMVQTIMHLAVSRQLRREVSFLYGSAPQYGQRARPERPAGGPEFAGEDRGAE